MPDLGKYIVEVLASYGASLALLAVIVLLTLRRGRAARLALQKAEQEAGRDGKA